MTSVWDQVKAEFSCDHDNTELRYKCDSLNRRQYQLQCLNCGDAVESFVPHSKIPNPKKIPKWDQVLPDNFHRMRRHRQKELYEQNSDDWWEQYKAYLESPEWRSKRQQVLQRDGFMCQSCQISRATQVHHLKGGYDYWPYDPIFNLTSVCSDCHQRITHIERGETDERDARRRAFLHR